MLERRKHGRSRDFALGAIADEGHRETLACVVRDLSEGGALLLLDDPGGAPETMRLALPGATHSARVVWRGPAAVGVVFAATDPGPDVPSRSAGVVSLDVERRRRQPGSDGQRLAERIARFVGAPRRPDLG